MNENVTVIGAGITGLVTAYELSKSGYSVDIIEANEEIGGLAASFLLHGTPIEKTYHHLFLGDADMLSLIEELGLGGNITWLSVQMGCFSQGKIHPFGTPWQLLRFRPLSIPTRIRVGLMSYLLQKKKDGSSFVPISAHSWLRQWYGEEAYRTLWEPLLRGKFHRHHRDVSMSWMWARIHSRAGSKHRTFAHEQLGYPHGGFRTVTDTLVRRLLSRGARFHLHEPVHHIRTRPDGRIVIDTQRGSREADAVVATLPSPTCARLLEGECGKAHKYCEQLNSIQYLGAVCLVFTSTQSLMPYYWVNILDTHFPFLVFLQHTNLVEPDAFGGLHVYYLATYAPHDHPLFTAPEEHVQRQFFDALRGLVPAFQEGCVRERVLSRLPHAQHVVDCDYPAKMPDYRTPLQGVYLANFSQIFPEDRGMSGAVREGRKIAALLMEDKQRSSVPHHCSPSSRHLL